MPWMIRFAIAAAISILTGFGIWFTYQTGFEAGSDKARMEWSEQKTEQLAALNQELIKARQREADLQLLAAKLRKEKSDEANRLARQYAVDLERLRNRPESRAGAGGVPQTAAAGVGCTGEGLARPDAQFLVWFAAEAAKLQSAYDECRVKHEATKE